MPQPFTIVDPNTNLPVATFDAAGNLIIKGSLVTGGISLNAGQAGEQVSAQGATGPTISPLTGIAAGAGGNYAQTTAAATPNATLNTYGSAVTIGADSGFAGIIAILALITSTGVGSETVTFGVTPTFKTAGAQAEKTGTLTTSTTVGEQNTSLFAALFRDGDVLISISFRCKSSINSSTASLTLSVYGISSS